MRLSEAIRIGAMLRPQTRNDYYRDGGSCAIGAACEAAGIRFIETPDLVEAFGPYWFMVGARLDCPACPETFIGGTSTSSRGRTITHLNDFHGWTRERIADFVELHEIDSMIPREEAVCDSHERDTETSASEADVNAVSI